MKNDIDYIIFYENMETQPDEILKIIFSTLNSIIDVNRLSLVCRRFNILNFNHPIWTNRIKKILMRDNKYHLGKVNFSTCFDHTYMCDIDPFLNMDSEGNMLNLGSYCNNTNHFDNNYKINFTKQKLLILIFKTKSYMWNEEYERKYQIEKRTRKKYLLMKKLYGEEK